MDSDASVTQRSAIHAGRLQAAVPSWPGNGAVAARSMALKGMAPLKAEAVWPAFERLDAILGRALPRQ